MKLGIKRPGTSTSFVDGVEDEALLQFSWNDAGLIQLAFHIYDCGGCLVADSGGVFPLTAVCITGPDGEVLLDVPEDPEEPVRYRLYNRSGRLLTTSDGARTQIFSFLQMDPKRVW
jgi:hypothetical protein